MSYTSGELAQLQLDAYNNRDIEQFAMYFAPDVQVFDQSTGECTLRGRDALHERYGVFFAANAGLHCELLNRIAEGRFAIDHERVTGLADGRELYAVAVYETDGEHITKVWFMRR